MPKQPAPTIWTPKIDLRDCGTGHHEICIEHAVSPWEDESGREWEPEEFEQAKLTTKWIATLGALTLGPLLTDIEVGKQLHRCQPQPARNKDGMLYKTFDCGLYIKDAKTIMQDGGGGSYISIPSPERKDWAAKVNECLTDVMAQMGADW